MSEVLALMSVMRLALTQAGHSSTAGTRIPPSYRLPFRARRPPLEPLGNEPLSLQYQSTVLSAMPSLRRPLRIFPSAASIAVISPKK